MKWKEAEILIRHNIIVGTKLDNRTVLEGPDFPCKGYNYNGTPGFKIKIGTKTSIEIPFIMLQAVYAGHGCHVHVIGRLFEKAAVATQVNKRKFKIL